MPRCWLSKDVKLNGQTVKARSPGVLLKCGDRWTVVDPSNDNVLIDGMTTGFKQRLIDKGLLYVEGS